MVVRDIVTRASHRCRVSYKLAQRCLCSMRYPLPYSPKCQGVYKRKHSVNKEEVNECYWKTAAVPHILPHLQTKSLIFCCKCGGNLSPWIQNHLAFPMVPHGRVIEVCVEAYLLSHFTFKGIHVETTLSACCVVQKIEGTWQSTATTCTASMLHAK